jgi:hypothetical protein
MNPTLTIRTGSDGASYPAYEFASYGDFYDNQLRIPCRIVFASDGTRRCLPMYGGGSATEPVGIASQSSTYFTDPGCTTFAWSVYSGTTCGVVGRFAVNTAEDTTVCPSRSLVTVYSYQPFSGTIYQITSTYTGSDPNGCGIYTKTCTAVGAPTTYCGFTPGAPGPFVTVTAVPPSTFVRFTP